MSGPQQPVDHDLTPPRQNVRIGAAFAGQPASFWVASWASLGVIIGGVGPWATYLNSVSVSGTSMHGWREVGVGVVGLVMLGLYQVRGGRIPLIVAGVVGALGLIGGFVALNKIVTGGAVTVFGVQYRYMDAAWGIYLVLAATATLLVCAGALAWRDFRERQ
jgi:hypothetical protein